MNIVQMTQLLANCLKSKTKQNNQPTKQKSLQAPENSDMNKLSSTHVHLKRKIREEIFPTKVEKVLRFLAVYLLMVD